MLSGMKDYLIIFLLVHSMVITQDELNILNFIQYGNNYTGEYRDGIRHGQGVFIYSNGDKYDGEWQNGMRSGRGVFIFKNSDKYVGEWKNDKRNGQGV